MKNIVIAVKRTKHEIHLWLRAVTLLSAIAMMAGCGGGSQVEYVTVAGESTNTTTTITNTVIQTTLGLSDMYSNDDTPSFSAGSLDAGTEAILLLGADQWCDGGDVKASVVSQGGAVTLNSSSLGSDGLYVFRVKVKWLDGRVTCSESVNYTLDRTAPSAPTVSSLPTSPYYSSGSSVTISGVCESGAAVIMSSDSSSTVTTCSSSAYSFTVSKDVDGTYGFTITQTDRAGNVSAGILQQWVRDTVAPSAPTVTSPAASPYYSSASTLAISGGCENNATVNVSGGATASATCANSIFNINISKSSDGTYDLTITQTDQAGLISSSVSQRWVRDTVAPSAVTITSPAVSPYYSNGSSVTISGACENGSTVSTSGSETSSTTCTNSAYSFTVTKSVDATYSFTLIQTDLSGNASSISVQQWVRDTVAPSAPTGWSLTNPTGGSTSSNKTPIVTVAGNGAEVGSLARVYIDSGCTNQVGSATAIAANSVNVTDISIVSDNGSNDGVKSFYGRITDKAGNVSVGCTTLSLSYTLETIPPVVSSIVRVGSSPTNASTVDFTVTFSESVSGVGTADFSVYKTGTISNASPASVVSLSGTQYTVTVNTGTGSGTLRLDLSDDDSITDNPAGNKLGGAGADNGNYMSGQSYTIDKSPPTVTVNQASDQWDPVTVFPILFDVTFSRSVTGFTTSDVSIGGTATGVTFTVNGSEANYQIRVTGANAAGTIIPSIVADAAVDSLGNPSAVSTSTDNTVTYQIISQSGAVKQIVTGHRHTCALLSGGKVRCWGYNNYGQLGYSSITNVGDDETPQSKGDIDLGGVAVQLASGAYHTCALLATGAVRCWGWGAYGQLGYSNINNIGDDEAPSSPSAGDVSIGLNIRQIVAGARHTCALSSTGKVKCWGEGASGQLGYGNTDTIGDGELPSSKGNVGLDTDVKQLAAGNFHTCALLATGKVRCWGKNDVGQLGYGHIDNIGDGEALSGDVDISTSDVIKIAAGGNHTCAMLSTGKLRCWGKNDYGQLGYGNINNIGDGEAPSSAGDVNLGENVIAVDVVVGVRHTCVLLSTGRAKCFGDGTNGQLGYGNTNTTGDDETPSFVGNISIGGEVIQLAAGETHTCALLGSGKVRCWGSKDYPYGQLGYANTSSVGDSLLPSSAGDVYIGGDAGAKEVVAGGLHTCSLSTEGKVRCWGKNDFGQLGYANTATAVAIGDNETPASAGYVSIGDIPAIQLSIGLNHSCALLANRKVLCWGQGTYGQLGYGNINHVGDDETPTSVGYVSVGDDVAQISASGFHTCAVLASGKVRCWGGGSNGRLGYADTVTIGDTEYPSSILNYVNVGGDVVQISTGDYHTCALLSNGAVRCWGYGFEGRLGYSNENDIGDNEDPSIAGNVSIGGSAVQVVANVYSSCVLLSSGDVRCWGAGGYGRLGYGDTTNNIGDTELPSTKSVLSIGGSALQLAAGEDHACALMSDGAVRCWGRGASGQLGYGNTNNIGDDEAPSTVAAVSVGGIVSSVTTGHYHTCAMLAAGSVRCWGNGDDGRLGYGNTAWIGDVAGEMPPADVAVW